MTNFDGVDISERRSEEVKFLSFDAQLLFISPKFTSNNHYL